MIGYGRKEVDSRMEIVLAFAMMLSWYDGMWRSPLVFLGSEQTGRN